MSDKFVTPCPLPNDYERELLTILIEECAEVQQRATKLLRFGCDEVQPGQDKSNSTRLAEEIGDLECVINWLESYCLIRIDDIETGRKRKVGRLRKYMQFAPPPPPNTVGR
jgi:NTP pyrophosphatase (non-canonical NTP hydrolase)